MTLEKIITEINPYAAPKTECDIFELEEYAEKYDLYSSKNKIVKFLTATPIILPLDYISLRLMDGAGLSTLLIKHFNGLVMGIDESLLFTGITMTIGYYTIASRLYDKIQIARYKNKSKINQKQIN